MHQKKNIQTLSVLEILCKGGEFSPAEILQNTLLSKDELLLYLQRLQQQQFPGLSFTEQQIMVREPVELLNVVAINGYLKESDLPIHLQLFEEINSTNEYLLTAELPSSSLNICAAEWQTDGRGRLGRRWFMPMASHLSFSFSRQLSHINPALNLLSLAAGVCVLDVLKAAGFHQLRLKWPNDIVVEDDNNLIKTGGILVETRTSSLTGIKWVIGVGLNMSDTRNFGEALMQTIAQPVMGLNQLMGKKSKKLSRNQLLAEIINHWAELEQKVLHEPDQIIQRWRDYDMLTGKCVEVTPASGSPYFGIARGIDNEGHLLVQRHQHNNRAINMERLEKLSSGEVKVRVKKHEALR